VKEFWTYTGLRLLLLLATIAIVFGIWFAFDHTVNAAWVVVIAFVISAPASYVVLNKPREAFAQRVSVRASRIEEKFNAAKAKEDLD
jgi:cytochrome bd-type quinol oxidase subunit 1